MNAMADFARRENAAAKAAWGIQPATVQIDWEKHDPHFSTKLVPLVMSNLRAGLGVDDMQVNGTCSADEARQVVAWLRKIGSLSAVYEAKK